MAETLSDSLNGCDMADDDDMHELNDIDAESHVFNNIGDICKYYTDDQVKDNVKMDNSFSLIHFNARSMYANFKEIKDYLDTFKQKFKVIALSETWMKENRGSDFYLEGYELYHNNRINKRGGGVALFVNSDLRCKVVENMTTTIDDLMECLTLEIELEGKRNIVIMCVYRTPGTNIDMFKDNLEELMNKLNENKTCLICGDTNIDLINVLKHRATSDFLDTLYSRGFYPLISKPSRITRTSATLIDNIFINNLESNIKSGLIINNISDHLPVFVTYNCQIKSKKEENRYRYVRLRTDESINKLRNDLLYEEWNGVYSEEVNGAYECFVERFLSHYDKNCPIIQCKNRSSYNKKPWITKGLQNACKKKNKLYKDFIKSRTTVNENKYKEYKNKLTIIMRQAKKEYYNKRLEENKHNLKGTWNILNQVIGNTKVSTDLPTYFTNDNKKVIENMNEVVNEFNSFFVNVGPSLAKAIPQDGQGDGGGEEGSKIMQSMFLEEVSENEIKSIILKSKNKISTDSDGIDMIIIKRTIDCIIKPLHYICNLSFRTGVFPDRMKTAKVIPLFKTGDKHEFTNYRPVSLLSQFSKVLEKLYVQRLNSFIEKNNLLSESQYGFRSNRSTSLALMKITEEITTAIDKYEHTIGVFIDLKKAFDTIDHNILISKLYKYGVRGIVLDWLISYLHNRQQYVQWGSYKSECLKLECGVPQGSVLGPKLFILYINDICEVSKIMQFVLFADDTNFFCSGNDLNCLAEKITNEMLKLKKWFNQNKLSLNLKKTKFMVFSNLKQEEVVLSIDGVDIERVNEFKFLGVVLDDKLTWKNHIAHVKSKVAKSLFILNKVKYDLEISIMRMLYCTLVLPYFMYCLEVWGNTYKSNIIPLILLQKRALRIIHKEDYRAHTNRLFILSRLLKIMDLVELRTLLVVHKAKNRELPEQLQKLFAPSSENEDHRRRHDFKHRFARTTLKQFCISVIGIQLWNVQKKELKSCETIFQYKKLFTLEKIKNYELDG